MQNPDLFLLEKRMLLALCETISSARALTVKLLVENGEWDQLLNLTVDPERYTKSSAFADDLLVSGFLKKSDNIPVTVDAEQECISSFYELERQNALTNARLYGAKHPAWFYDVQTRVREIMGPLTKKALDSVVNLAGFGPGANVGVKSEGLVKSIKYDAVMHLTHSLVPFRRSIMGQLWWEHNSMTSNVVPGNQFFTVPKSATKRRGCCKEPGLNSYIQMGIGRWLVKRLGHFGVDLRDQTRNQELARQAYSSNLATLDLSNASDLMSRATVSELVSYDWDHLLSLARSPFTAISGEWVELQKHSSMGNGYTFPLETVIFKAVCDVSVPLYDHASISVYGDDIICPQYAARDVIDRLEYLGFQVNRTKSHLAGDYFESCGKDFFRGVPVRPFFARKQKDSTVPIPYELQLLNGLRHYSALRGGGDCDGRFHKVWKDFRGSVPTPWRNLTVPPHFGDCGVIVSEAEARCANAFNWHDSQLEGKVVKYVRIPPVNKDRRSLGVYLATRELGGTGDFTRGREAPRGMFGKPLVRKAVTVWPPGYNWVF